ncbi:hypothetical protein QJQ45_002188 [Haematococcus lacustris]|nr:hypothetical protein QJQ45_002188 [Haematococcus lacustris]
MLAAAARALSKFKRGAARPSVRAVAKQHGVPRSNLNDFINMGGLYTPNKEQLLAAAKVSIQAGKSMATLAPWKRLNVTNDMMDATFSCSIEEQPPLYFRAVDQFYNRQELEEQLSMRAAQHGRGACVERGALAAAGREAPWSPATPPRALTTAGSGARASPTTTEDIVTALLSLGARNPSHGVFNSCNVFASIARAHKKHAMQQAMGQLPKATKDLYKQAAKHINDVQGRVRKATRVASKK